MILDTISYINAIEEILFDHTKLSNLDIPAGKEINYIRDFEIRLTSDLKLLKDEEIIDKPTYQNIKPVGSRPGVLYRLGKVLKKTKNGLLLFPSNFVSYWYPYIQTNKVSSAIFDTFNSK